LLIAAKATGRPDVLLRAQRQVALQDSRDVGAVARTYLIPEDIIEAARRHAGLADGPLTPFVERRSEHRGEGRVHIQRAVFKAARERTGVNRTELARLIAQLIGDSVPTIRQRLKKYERGSRATISDRDFHTANEIFADLIR